MMTLSIKETSCVKIITLLLCFAGSASAQWTIALDKDRDEKLNLYSGLAASDGNIYVCGAVEVADFDIRSFFDKSTNHGITWERIIPASLPEVHGMIDDMLHRIVLLGSNVVIAVGDSGLVVASYDGGKTFNVQNNGTKLKLTDVAITTEGLAVATGNYGSVGISEDTGKTWTFKELIGYTVMTNCQAFGKDTIYLIGNNNYIFRSFDKGDTWDSVKFHPQVYTSTKGMRAYDAHFWSSKEGIIVGFNLDGRPEGEYNGIILYTSDAGTTWQTIFDQWISGRANGFRCVDFIDRNHGVIGTNRDVILKTSDGGVTWQYDTIVISKSFIRIKDDIVYLANKSIFANILIDPVYGAIVSSTTNASVYTPQEGTMSIAPNPATATVTFQVASPMLKAVVYDGVGREIEQVQISSGEHQITYDCRHLLPGVYFIKVLSKDQSITTAKFIKL